MNARGCPFSTLVHMYVGMGIQLYWIDRVQQSSINIVKLCLSIVWIFHSYGQSGYRSCAFVYPSCIVRAVYRHGVDIISVLNSPLPLSPLTLPLIISTVSLSSEQLCRYNREIRSYYGEMTADHHHSRQSYISIATDSSTCLI